MVSILLTVGAVLMVSMLPGREAGDVNSKVVTTVERMQKVEVATQGFMAAYGRRPCPADGQYAPGNVNFGLEAATPGTCTGGTPAAPLGPDAATSHVVAGTIPTRTLNIPDEYEFDEWGRRITYVVDKRATSTSSCPTMQNYPTNNGTGDVVIHNAAGAVSDHTAYAYISHGPDGHGAWPSAGGGVAARINVGSIDTDTLDNASVDAAFVTSFDNVFIRKSRTATFDDLVYYRPDLKNSCCIGSACVGTSLGFRIDGSVASEGVGASLAHLDFDCDSKQDLLVLQADGSNSYNQNMYVIFGSTTAFPNPLPIHSLDGNNGIKLASDGGNYFGPLTVGDIDNDGCDDIIYRSNSYIHVLYGMSSWKGNAASYDTGALTGGACQMVTFWPRLGTAVNPYDTIVIKDVDGDGKNDMIMSAPSANTNKGYVYVMFGLANSCTGPNHSGTGTYFNGLDPTTLTHSGVKDQANVLHASPKGLKIVGPSATGDFGASGALAAGDVNGDGKNDILIGDGSYNASAGRIYIVFGQSSATWAATDTITASALNGSAGSPAGSILSGSGWPNNTLGKYSLLAGDITGDGTFADIITATDNAGYHWIIPGHANPWNATYTWAALTKFRADANDDQDYMYYSTADVNGDGKLDLIMPDKSSNLSTYGSVVYLFGPITATRDVRANPVNGTDGVQLDCPSSVNGTCQYGIGLDINADGIGDMVVEGSGGDVTAGNYEGYAYVLYGKSTAWTSPYSLSTIH